LPRAPDELPAPASVLASPAPTEGEAATAALWLTDPARGCETPVWDCETPVWDCETPFWDEVLRKEAFWRLPDVFAAPNPAGRAPPAYERAGADTDADPGFAAPNGEPALETPNINESEPPIIVVPVPKAAEDVPNAAGPPPWEVPFPCCEDC
jgi:hypothetical protein